MSRLPGGLTETHAAYDLQQLDALTQPGFWLRWMRWRLGRRTDGVSRARRLAIEAELLARAARP